MEAIAKVVNFVHNQWGIKCELKHFNFTIAKLLELGVIKRPAEILYSELWDKYTAALAEDTKLTGSGKSLKAWEKVEQALRRALEEQETWKEARMCLSDAPHLGGAEATGAALGGDLGMRGGRTRFVPPRARTRSPQSHRGGPPQRYGPRWGSLPAPLPSRSHPGKRRSGAAPPCPRLRHPCPPSHLAPPFPASAPPLLSAHPPLAPPLPPALSLPPLLPPPLPAFDTELEIHQRAKSFWGELSREAREAEKAAGLDRPGCAAVAPWVEHGAAAGSWGQGEDTACNSMSKQGGGAASKTVLKTNQTTQLNSSPYKF